MKVPFFHLELGEVLLLVLFIAMSGGMVFMSLDFSPAAGAFPRMFGSVVLAGSLFLLIRNQLPASVKAIMNKYSTDVTLAYGDTGGKQDHQMRADGLVLIVFTGVYLGFTTVIGFIWASFVFTVVYMYYYDKTLLIIAATSLLVLSTGFIFQMFTDVPLNQGMLQEWLA